METISASNTRSPRDSQTQPTKPCGAAGQQQQHGGGGFGDEGDDSRGFQLAEIPPQAPAQTKGLDSIKLPVDFVEGEKLETVAHLRHEFLPGNNFQYSSQRQRSARFEVYGPSAMDAGGAAHGFPMNFATLHGVTKVAG